MKCRPYQIKKCIFGIKIIDVLFQINLISWKQTLVVYFKEKKKNKKSYHYLSFIFNFSEMGVKK